MNIKAFQEKIGYKFHHEGYLRQALTHSSFAHERKLDKLMDNERLEFLGDAVLEIITSEFLFKNYPDKPEGDLTKLRASIVCEQTLAMCAKAIDLGDHIDLGHGEEITGGRGRKSIVSDAMEAVIGAIYLDGGFKEAREFITKFILTDIEEKHLFYDSKTILQEYVQKTSTEQLTYILVDEQGPDHAKVFTVEAHVGDKIVGRGVGQTKKAAEQEAAYKALLDIKDKDAKKE